MREVAVAAVQFACTDERRANVATAISLIREAHAAGAQVILLQELFETPYFCKDEEPRHFALARPLHPNDLLDTFRSLARELEVALPVSFFESSGNAFFNSVAMLDADGSLLGVYRKSHIPESPGYQEKFYFSPGDTGFRVWHTRYGRLGVGICWDQWFPEAARCMALQNADLLLYPTAIGSEPSDASLDSMAHWQRVMQGHAAANLVPVVASNRIGREVGAACEVTFYGSSFITDHSGEKLGEARRDEQGIVHAVIDVEAARQARVAWGVFRDRRPDLYGRLLTLDGGRPDADR